MLGFLAGLFLGHILTNDKSSNREVRDVPETHTPRPCIEMK